MKTKKRMVWMDDFSVESCCQRDNLEKCSREDEKTWLPVFFSVGNDESEESGKNGFIPLKCKTCGRFWFEVLKGGRWTAK